MEEIKLKNIFGKPKDQYNNLIVKRKSKISLSSLDKLNAIDQFLMDMAMWYGFLANPSDQKEKQWKSTTVSRVFNILLNGGLMVKRKSEGWLPWCEVGPLFKGCKQPAPVASVISHTARVLVQLPSGDKEKEFWKWLWAGVKPQTRKAATHGVEAVKEIESLGKKKLGVNKFAKENKSGKICNHFGINIALGGEGNINPVSGNKIYPNGEHGHLYFALSKKGFGPTKKQRKVLLIATEQSAPLDRYSGKIVGGEKKKLARVPTVLSGTFSGNFGVPDQYGGAHGLGGHQLRAANGGQDWTNKYLKNKKDDRLKDYGPGPEGSCYLDGMFIDLTNERFDYIKKLKFTKDHLGEIPNLPK